MQDPTQTEEPTETINVVPLADLTLVLLIILMVLSPMITQSMIHVATPAVKSEKQLEPNPEDAKKPSEPLLIAITAKGYALNSVYADGLDQLMAALKARLAEDPARQVLVTAENQITVGAVVRVLDLAKQNGADHVSLLKRAEENVEGKGSAS
jgi:biopolymer transport protein ExbD